MLMLLTSVPLELQVCTTRRIGMLWTPLWTWPPSRGFASSCPLPISATSTQIGHIFIVCHLGRVCFPCFCLQGTSTNEIAPSEPKTLPFLLQLDSYKWKIPGEYPSDRPPSSRTDLFMFTESHVHPFSLAVSYIVAYRFLATLILPELIICCGSTLTGLARNTPIPFTPARK